MQHVKYRTILAVTALVMAGASPIAADVAADPAAAPKSAGMCPPESYHKLQIVTQLKQRGYLAMTFPALDLTEGRVGCDAPELMDAIKKFQKSINCPETGGLDQAQLDFLEKKSLTAPSCDGSKQVEIQPPPPPAKVLTPEEVARDAFVALNLDEESLKRSYRGLYRLKHVTSDVVVTDFTLPEIVTGVKAYQAERGHPQTGYLSRDEVTALDWVGEHPFPNEADQKAESDWNYDGRDWITVYNQLAAYLRYNGIDRNAASVTRDDIKTIQNHAGLRKTGYLNAELYDFVSRQLKSFKPRDFTVNSTLGDWAVGRQPVDGGGSSCYIFNNALRVEGRYGQEMTAYMLFSYETTWNNSNLHIRFGEGSWFDEKDKITLTAGETTVDLSKADDGYLKPTINPDDNSVSTGPFIALADTPFVKISGTSSLGGKLNLYYANSGFRRALQDINQGCAGGRLDVWLQ